MRTPQSIRAAISAVMIALAVGVTGHRVTAQSVLDRIKKAAEDAQKAGQKQKPPPTQPASQPQTPTQPASQPQANAAGGVPTLDDCCSADALKKIAAASGFVDIVGIKLGMTPEQAFAAVKAFNAEMKIDVVQTRMTTPDAPGTFT